jgi:predicted N-formylglutamate amidohydrolase
LSKPRPEIFFSCEHSDNRVPRRFRKRFQGSERLLASHRGYDTGAGALAMAMAAACGVKPACYPWTRLLIDANRSLTSRSLFSAVSKKLPEPDRRFLVESLYLPYRTAVEKRLHRPLKNGACVIHVSVHTFAPDLNGLIRTADIGFLYDPSRLPESRLCKIWKSVLHQRQNRMRIRMNYPYRGVSDGLVSALRGTLSGFNFVGLELEVNQKWVLSERSQWNRLKQDLAETFHLAVFTFTSGTG